MSLNAIGKRFSALKSNERRLVMIAAIGGLLLIGYSFLIEPAEQTATHKRELLKQQQSELAALQDQLPVLRQQANDPDAGLRLDIANTQRHIGSIEDELRQFDHLLVSPTQMPRLLQAMLAKHRSLSLVSLKTLPAQPLLAPVIAQPGAAPAPTGLQAMPAISGDKPAPPPGGIYRHGVEITVAGSYAQLLAYADELQRITPRPLWSSLQLKVVEYPRSELTFTLYTISLDLPWLAV
jgi:MSHA biogenesis protein MshJ